MIRQIRKVLQRIFVILFLLMLSAHRLPAPISEVPETTPTPKPKREATPKPKLKPALEATPKPTAAPNRSFAGSWTGLSGALRTRIILINPSQTTATIDGGPWGRETGIIEEINGNQLSWTTTPLSVHVKWTLTLLPGAKTAQVVTRHFLGGESGTFEKKQ